MKIKTQQNQKTDIARTNSTSAKKQNSILPDSANSIVERIMFLQRTMGNKAVQRLIQLTAFNTTPKTAIPSSLVEKEALYAQGPSKEPEEEEIQSKPLDRQTLPRIQAEMEEEEDVARLPVEEEEPVCGVQEKLTMGSPGDVYEQEADRVADAISSEGGMSDLSTLTSLQEKLLSSIDPRALGGLTERTIRPIVSTDSVGSKKLAVNRKQGLPLQKDGSISGNIERRILQSKGNGSRLSPQMNSYMSIQTGYDFSNVRVKSDSESANLNRTLGARAFTNGSDVWLGKGEKATDVKLMTHELTHVIQQGAAKRIQPQSNAFSQILASKGYMPKFMQALSKNADGNSSLFQKGILQFIKEYPSSRMNTLQAQILDGAKSDSINRRESAQTLRGCLTGCKGGGTSSTRRAELKSGPTYSPNGTLKATVSGGKKYSPKFTMTAEFKHDSSKGIYASCGEVRQYIKWSSDADRPNHAGFTPASSYKANTWYEDRSSAGDPFGHRVDAKSTCGYPDDKYLDTTGKLDCANGPKYSGYDRPMDGSGKKTGEWDFKLNAINTCNGNKVLGTDTLKVDW